MGIFHEGMPKMLREIGLSWVFCILIGWTIWPPGAVYWPFLAKYIGQAFTLLVVGFLATGFGFAFVYLTDVQLRHFLAGAAIAYLSGMIAIETILLPDSPVHLILYGGLLLAIGTGGFLGNYLR